ncbi:MAG: hypothetical protein ACOVNP_07690 [Flavobacterium sp.]
MEELTTTMLINFFKEHYLNEEDLINLQDFLESCQRLELARLRSAFDCGRLEQLKNSDTTGQDYVNNKYVTK